MEESEIEMMTKKQFLNLIHSYGIKVKNWPKTQRATMQAFRVANPHIEALIGREKRLDEWLDARLPDAPEALGKRIIDDMSVRLGACQNTVATPIAAPIPKPTQTRIKIQKVLTATSRQASVIGLAASFLIGLIVAPDLLETFFGGPELIASLDILSDEFLLD